MKHIMIDLETLGTNPDAVFLTAGLVRFNIETGEASEFGRELIHINMKSSLDAGRKVNADTIQWWFNQSKEAQQALFDEQAEISLEAALHKINKFVLHTNPNEKSETSYNRECYVWSNGSNFDIAILQNAYQHYNLKIPWQFWNIRDVRTLVDLASDKVNVKNIKFKGEPHNALDDALHQIKYCSLCWKALREGKE